MSDAILVTTTFVDQADAQRMAAALVARQLAACVQISGPIESTYRWKGQIETSQEWVCSIKTTQRLFPEVEQAIRDLHSYEQPEIVAVPILTGNRGYLDWLVSSVKP